jgi:hypothetical protein
MSVYVDVLVCYGVRVGRLGPETKWCHMFADSLEELHAMASAIGMKRTWFQDKPGFPHYDLVASKRAKAVALGAVEVDGREFVRITRRLREQAGAAGA